jgi:predicted phosphodiesterase
MNIPLGALVDICNRHRARVIVIGDVHGCVDEFRDLLIRAKYMPGDLVLLLGDLVAKGPHSVEVSTRLQNIYEIDNI